jgi:SAM-dependent methyltransferase
VLPALVHPADLFDLAARIRRSGVRILARPFLGHSQRTQAAWTHISSPPRHWTDIPLVQERIRTKITGNEQEDLPAYVVRSYHNPRKPWRGLSLGCGTGRREMRWFHTGAFASFDAIDLSPTRIAEAQHTAIQAGVSDRLHFSVADIRSYQPVDRGYDIVLIEDALHHFSPMEAILRKVRGWLGGTGILVINEYVGPSRFQWTRAQLVLVNRLLEEFPQHLRVRYDGTRKPRVHRPGTLTMRLYDPSEAIQSSEILSAIRSLYHVNEERPYGGTILHLLLKDLAHHFLELDNERRALLLHCCEQEDLAMKDGTIESDYRMVVAGAAGRI